MAPFMEDDLVLTLSDHDIVSDEEQGPHPVKKRKREAQKQSAIKKQRMDGEEEDEERDFDPDFEFALEDGAVHLDDYEALMGDKIGLSAKKGIDIDEIIACRASPQSESEAGDDDMSITSSAMSEDGFGRAADLQDSNDDEGSESQSGSQEDAAVPTPHPDDHASGSEADEVASEDPVEEEKRQAFFAAEAHTTNATALESFQKMGLSRPILKGLGSIGFNTPTPIQSKAIPVAMAGKDVVGGAVTGSGKTAAFIIPILERLMHRSRKTATTRVAILAPTRELALQCFTFAKKLSEFTDITFGQAIGGLNSREQEKQLKLRPDIVIATPGRFIDLERNSPSFAVNTIEILVLDEADRMLEEGFADELNEILSKIPKSRQTMLFSATMTSKVDDLIRAGLQRPVRLMVDAQKSTVAGLVQEFVRLRPGREKKRLGYLTYLCKNVHTERVIVFFRQKKDAHRVRVLFALLGLKAAELHGSMTQEQRIQAIESFRAGRASFLLATDLASRGLDIKGIETVINFEAPQSHEIYLHRVGRTARAGRTGKACTLAAEPDRKVVKAAVKGAKAQGAAIRQRTVTSRDADEWQAKCDKLQGKIEDVLREEKEERAISNTERQIARADNIVTHKEEIMARPKKTWFESEADKMSAKDRGRVVLNGGETSSEVKQKKRKTKLSNKQKKKLLDRDDRKAGKVWRGKNSTERGKKAKR